MSSVPVSVREALRRAVLEHAPWLGTRGVGLKLSHVITHVGAVALGPGAASLEAGELAARAEACVPIMDAADSLARRVMDRCRGQLSRPLRDTEMSLPVALSCGAHLRRHGELPDAPDDEAALASAVATQIVEGDTMGRPLSPDEFASTAGVRYAQLWLAQGAANLATWPPSRISLGHDEQPPLVTATTDDSHTWLEGTDRSVHARYRLYFSRAARRRTNPRRRHVCRQDAERRSVSDAVDLSVRRACDPYGLEHEGHRRLLRTLAAHTDGPWRGRPEEAPTAVDLVDWDERCVPLPDVDGEDQSWLEERVRAQVEAWWRRGTGALLRDRWGDLDGELHLLRLLLVRRAWQSLLGRERDQLATAGLCVLDGLLGTALTRGVGQELPSLLRGETTLAPPPSVQRVNATLGLICAAGEVEELPRTTDEIVDRYARVLADRGTHPGVGCLTMEEFAALVSGSMVWEEAG